MAMFQHAPSLQEQNKLVLETLERVRYPVDRVAPEFVVKKSTSDAAQIEMQHRFAMLNEYMNWRDIFQYIYLYLHIHVGLYISV